ncbi:MAG: hypothetical protein PHY64_11105 [Eubacteriales bacterium]|nr:hypothetical protein [Eubacteriales bacterium]
MIAISNDLFSEFDIITNAVAPLPMRATAFAFFCAFFLRVTTSVLGSFFSYSPGIIIWAMATASQYAKISFVTVIFPIKISPVPAYFGGFVT